jgi:hypothetical protein
MVRTVESFTQRVTERVLKTEIADECLCEGRRIDALAHAVLDAT